MKTTLQIDDEVMARRRREAARTGRTMSELVDSALRLMLGRKRDRPSLPPLPSFDSGGSLVDVARLLDRFGPRAGEMRAALDSEGGWAGLLSACARCAEAR